MTGERVGKWLVTSLAAPISGRPAYTCKCDCGTIKVVRRDTLRRGVSRSCGCVRKQPEFTAASAAARKERMSGLEGCEFGRLTVVSVATPDSRGQTRYDCKCRCGNTKVVRAHELRAGSAMSCGCSRAGKSPSMVCECGNERRRGKPMCDRCHYLDSDGESAIIYSELRMFSPCTVEFLVNTCGIAEENVYRALAAFRRAGKAVSHDEEGDLVVADDAGTLRYQDGSKAEGMRLIWKATPTRRANSRHLLPQVVPVRGSKSLEYAWDNPAGLTKKELVSRGLVVNSRDPSSRSPAD